MTRVYHSIPTTAYLASILERAYSLEIDRIYLYREMGGSIYYVSTKSRDRFVLKVYKAYHTAVAVQAADVMEYLEGNGFPVAPIVKNRDGGLLTAVSMPECECLAALHPFVDGHHPDVGESIQSIGRLAAELHEAMKTYPRPLTRCSRQVHIDDFIAFMTEHFGARESDIRELEEYGHTVWERVENLPAGFCHNDFHNHNMILQDQRIVLFDFDTASVGHPMFDVASICDRTDFWKVTPDDVDSTLTYLEQFNDAYSTSGSLSDGELASVFGCIAVRHCRLHGIRDRAPIRGSSHMTEQWFDDLMTWQRDFREMTERAI